MHFFHLCFKQFLSSIWKPQRKPNIHFCMFVSKEVNIYAILWIYVLLLIKRHNTSTAAHFTKHYCYWTLNDTLFSFQLLNMTAVKKRGRIILIADPLNIAPPLKAHACWCKGTGRGHLKLHLIFQLKDNVSKITDFLRLNLC